MHHEVAAPAAGVVRGSPSARATRSRRASCCFAIEPTAAGPDARRRRRGGRRRPRRGARRPRRGARAPPPDARRGAPGGGRAAPRDRAAGRRARTSRTSATTARSASTAASRSPRSARRRASEDLIEKTPGDGIVTGIGAVNGDVRRERSRCAVLAYDYTVLAGTQGVRNHRKTDRMLELAERASACRSCCSPRAAEGGPGDTDQSELFHLDVPTFRDVRAAQRPRAAGRDRLGPLLRRQRRAARLLRRDRRDPGGDDRHGRPGDDRGRRARRVRARGGRAGRRCRRRTA